MFVNKEEVLARIDADFDFFSALVLGEDFQFDWPETYIAFFQLIVNASSQSRDFSKFALGLPRGFAKTTFAKLLVVFLITRGNKSFIAIAGANLSLAENIIRDIWNFLASDNMVAIFGNPRIQVEKDSSDMKIFHFCGRTVIIAGVGARGSPRGWNIANKRPDFLLLDDVQTREDSESDIETARLFTWVFSTFLYTRSPFGATTLYLGNMYPGKNSILQKLTELPNWKSFVVGGILANGTSLWEELFPISILLEDYQSQLALGREDIFASEILNNNDALQSVKFSGKDFKPIPALEGELPQGKFIMIDPSGEGKHSDKTAIGLFYMWDGKPAAKTMHAETMSPKDTILYSILVALREGCRLIAVESVAYQATLLFWFNEVLKTYRIEGIECVPITSGIKSKNNRIKHGINSMKSGDILVYPECQKDILDQVREWKPNKTKNVDDILDLIAYAPKVVELYGGMLEFDIVTASTTTYQQVLTASENSYI